MIFFFTQYLFPKQIGELKKGLNPVSITDLGLGSPYFSIAIKTGIITGVIALAVFISFFICCIKFDFFFFFVSGREYMS